MSLQSCHRLPEADCLENLFSHGVIGITGNGFDIGAHIEAVKQPTTGAVVTFLGVVRDDGIECLEVEAWEEVALEDMHAIREEAGTKFDLQDVTIIHRIGKLAVGEPILLIVVSSGHRKQAFRGCEYILERIKEQAPFWKREYVGDQDRWVPGNRE